MSEAQVIKGWVKKLNTRDGVGRGGKKWYLHSVKLELDDGTEYDKWISLGFEKPAIKDGDYVRITVQENDKGYLQATETKAIKNPPARAAVASGGGGAAKGAGVYVSATQTSIHYQSARKDAIEVLKLLMAQDALPISSAKTKAGEAKRFEEITALVDKMTVQYFYDAETHRLLTTVADAGKIDVDPGKLPDDDETIDEDPTPGDEDDSDDE